MKTSQRLTRWMRYVPLENPLLQLSYLLAQLGMVYLLMTALGSLAQFIPNDAYVYFWQFCATSVLGAFLLIPLFALLNPTIRKTTVIQRPSLDHFLLSQAALLVVLGMLYLLSSLDPSILPPARISLLDLPVTSYLPATENMQYVNMAVVGLYFLLLLPLQTIWLLVGVVYRRLRENLELPAWVCVVLVASMIMMSQVARNLYELAGLFLVGLAASVVFERTRNLLLPFLVYAAYMWLMLLPAFLWP